MGKRKVTETSAPVDENADQWLTTRNKKKISPPCSRRKPGGRLPVSRILTANTAARPPLLTLCEENLQKQGVAATHQTSLLRFFPQRLKPLPLSSTSSVDSEVDGGQENSVPTQPSTSQEEEEYQSHGDMALCTQEEGGAACDSFSKHFSGVTSPLPHFPQKTRKRRHMSEELQVTTGTLNSTDRYTHKGVKENVCDADVPKSAPESPRYSAEKHGKSSETSVNAEIKRQKLETSSGDEIWQNAPGKKKATENSSVFSTGSGMHVGVNDGTPTDSEITVSETDSDSQDTNWEGSLETPVFLQIKNTPLVHADTGTVNNTSDSMRGGVGEFLAELTQTPAFLQEKPENDHAFHSALEGSVAEQTHMTCTAEQLETPTFLIRRCQDISAVAPHAASFTVNSTLEVVDPFAVDSAFFATTCATDSQNGSFPEQTDIPSLEFNCAQELDDETITSLEITKETGSFGMSALCIFSSQGSDSTQLSYAKEKSSLEQNRHASSSLESDNNINDIHNAGISDAPKVNPHVHAAMHKRVKKPVGSGIKDRRNEKEYFNLDLVDD